jgi:hypothetical protein
VIKPIALLVIVSSVTAAAAQGQPKSPQEYGPSPEALRAYQKTEIEKWWPIIKRRGSKPNELRP